jgi:prephenate dehydrogenase
MEERVTIVGLGCVGASIGLALREVEPETEVVGHDRDGERARKAHRMGAVTRTHWNLPAACEGATMVVLALPLPAVRETMEALAPHLEAGCLVTDTAPLKVPVVAWAREYLPQQVDFVTGNPIPGPAAQMGRPLRGLEAAAADLFEGGLYCIAPSGHAGPEAVDRLIDLAHILGAQPLFLDPSEHDGLHAGVVDLPGLIAVALLSATVDSPGWAEMRKVAGYEFASFTGPAALDSQNQRESAMLNRENVLRRLDMFLEEMGYIRQLLEDGDDTALSQVYVRAAEGRARWVDEHARGEWREAQELDEVPGIGRQISQMLFGGWLRRSREDES